MVAHIYTVAFEGIEARLVDVQVSLTGGLPAFNIVGLGDKAVAESKERVRSALSAIGLGLPPKRITVNLAPADLPKEGSHYDLPIALGLLVVMDILPADYVARFLAIGELSLDGTVSPVAGALPAAIAAAAAGKGLICPADCGPEAAWAGDVEILTPAGLIALVNHVKGSQMLSQPKRGRAIRCVGGPDLRDVKGQQSARRALEIAAAGGHNLLMVGPPGAGKSMLAERLPGILPPMSSEEMLEVSMIQSVAGMITKGRISESRPFRSPHHSASMAAMVGGGLRVRPGEVSLAHMGVLFLDELPEFSRTVLDSLRQPLESGKAVIARANAHVSYPARLQLVAAMNPCRCGYAADLGRACRRGAHCIADYQAKISGPLMDRIDMHIELPGLTPAELTRPPDGEDSATVAGRVAAARQAQRDRYRAAGAPAALTNAPLTNAHVETARLEKVATPCAKGQAMLAEAADRFQLTARGYHRLLRVARTLADLDGRDAVGVAHVAEALSYRRRLHTPDRAAA